ncbi:uncharacterized protein MELLADRAFT_95730 [Melampsora larici-populina 98AG31]|uniref:Uncharacterized protein n=1 Tax=Melampsora larici-populina (strain 98AG31 / pathotype 3-4-7) TaxID=747676 RepID=F4SAE4_MELLP|nr:uncharacterized protein MELLADRAFT_95730 [Melampsora larici-populina 98AG31]EGF98389.1 hypothetical protein MELLADRAFT_95730 [Melampsora larici-populina 98AG31]
MFRSTRLSTQLQTTKSNPPKQQPSRRNKRNRTEVDSVDNIRDQDNRPPSPAANQTAGNSHIQPDTSSTIAIKLSEITVHTYNGQKKYWPLPRIEEQLAHQKPDNNSKPSPLILAEAKSLYANFIHSINMLAMIGAVSVDTLKAKIGLTGATRENSTWTRFLSFAKEANQLPMPPRGDPNAKELLSARNKANKRAYDFLTEVEVQVFTPRVFYALGGYPDYSAISVEDHKTSGDFEVLIPEVPKLSDEEEALYRPLYNKLVNADKVNKDREATKPPSPARMEQRSLQAFKNKTLDPGWCEEATTRPAVRKWLEKRHNFQSIFPIYSQAKLECVEDIDKAAAEVDGKVTVQNRRVPNKSDIEKTTLTELLTQRIVQLVGMPANGLPRGPDPPSQFRKNHINVEFVRSPDSAMTNEEFMKGFDGMLTLGRRHWLQDLADGKFKMVLKLPTTSTQPQCHDDSNTSTLNRHDDQPQGNTEQQPQVNPERSDADAQTQDETVDQNSGAQLQATSSTCII